MLTRTEVHVSLSNYAKDLMYLFILHYNFEGILQGKSYIREKYLVNMNICKSKTS